MKTDYIKREIALDAFCKDCRGLERGKCEYYDNGCKPIETLLFVHSEAVVPKDFHDKTCEAMAKRHTEEIQKMYEEGDHDCKSEQTERDGLQMNMEEYKVRLGEDVVLDLGIGSDWYISELSYDRVSVTITLHSKKPSSSEKPNSCKDEARIITDGTYLYAYDEILGEWRPIQDISGHKQTERSSE